MPGTWYIRRKASLSISSRPLSSRGQAADAGVNQPLFETARSSIRRLACRSGSATAVARIELPHQFGDDGRLVLLHQIPQRHDRSACRAPG